MRPPQISSFQIYPFSEEFPKLLQLSFLENAVQYEGILIAISSSVTN